MRQSLKGKIALLILGVVIAVFIAAGYFATSDKPEEYLGFVSDSPSPTGVKAFYTYLDQEKGAVQSWSHEPILLPDNENNQLLIMVEPSFTPDKEAINAYTSFMEAGNTIFLLKANPEGMFGIQTEPSANEPGEGKLQDGSGETFHADKNSPFRITSQDGNVLLEDDSGALATRESRGNGTLVTAVAPDWVINDKILEKDHLELLFSLLPEEDQDWTEVYFDEYIHGSQNAATVTSLYPDWLLITGFQAILFTIIFLWYRGKRFGSIEVPREESVRFSNERIRALAAWYRRGRLYHDSLLMQADYVRLLMQERWGIPYHQDWTDIYPQLVQKHASASAKELQTFLSGLKDVLRHESLNKKDYISWSRKLDGLRKEVEGQ